MFWGAFQSALNCEENIPLSVADTVQGNPSVCYLVRTIGLNHSTSVLRPLPLSYWIFLSRPENNVAANNYKTGIRLTHLSPGHVRISDAVVLSSLRAAAN
jgi:hypothetical protein